MGLAVEERLSGNGTDDALDLIVPGPLQGLHRLPGLVIAAFTEPITLNRDSAADGAEIVVLVEEPIDGGVEVRVERQGPRSEQRRA